MQVADDGGFVLTGYTYSFGIGENMYLIKTDSEGLVTAIISDDPVMPQSFKLHQNYPNPFNPATTISYQLSAVSQVELSIYNLLGQKVATLVDRRQPAGVYQVKWDGTAYPSGVYYYRLLTDTGFNQTKKLILLK
jgi:hypothetical protein